MNPSTDAGREVMAAATHLYNAAQLLGSRADVCRDFNQLPAQLFVLTYDETFGVWILRVAS